MSKKRALITGISGQDGYYLTRHLLNLNYDVFGIVRRHSQFESETPLLTEFKSQVNVMYGDLMDVTSLESAVHMSQPHEIYNLAAQSHVRVSFDAPQFTTQVNALGTLNILEATRKIAPYARFYQASTSEMFGNEIGAYQKQRESTPMVPVSPYGASKLFGHNLVNQYRNSYGLFACSGILFNHESPMRGGNFLTQKVVRGAVRISLGQQDKLELGNLTAYRDWGHAADYVEAMHLMLQRDIPSDYVVATGKVITVEQFVIKVFETLNLDWTKYVVTHPTHERPEDVHYLCGDASKIKKALGWTPTHTLETLILDMIDSAKTLYSK